MMVSSNLGRRALRASCRAFTLLELLVATAVLMTLLVFLGDIIGRVENSYRSAESRLGQFREARRAFDTIKSNLAAATTAPYTKLLRDGGNTSVVPDGFTPAVSLDFRVMNTVKREINVPGATAFGSGLFFFGNFGESGRFRQLAESTSGRGYFLIQGAPQSDEPSWLSSTSYQSSATEGFWLMELRANPAPEETYDVDTPSSENRGSFVAKLKSNWYDPSEHPPSALLPLAKNVIFFKAEPVRINEGKTEFADPENRFDYDVARNQTALEQAMTRGRAISPEELARYQRLLNPPPLVRISMIVISETDARLVESGDKTLPFDPTGVTHATLQSVRDDLDVKDSSSLVSGLDAAGFEYQVFSSLIQIRAASL